MAVTARISGAIDKDISILVSEATSPAERSRIFAQFAREQIAEASQTNTRILGRVPRSTTYVDGREGAALETVKPDGIIFTEFEIIDNTLKYIADQLEAHSPVLTGRYQKSHTLIADGVEVDPHGVIPSADEYVFINTQPYARKIERGFSSQSPEGVYQVVAALAQRRISNNVAKITYSFRTVIGGRIIGGKAGDRSAQRNPAIVVRIRD